MVTGIYMSNLVMVVAMILKLYEFKVHAIDFHSKCLMPL